MHVNVRKDICFPSACIRFERTETHSAICAWCPSDASPRSEHACERVHVCDKCALQLRTNASERTSARHMTLFLTHCHYRFTLTFCRASSEKKSKSKRNHLSGTIIYPALAGLHLLPRKQKDYENLIEEEISKKEI